MVSKILIALFLLAIVVALFSGMVFMLRDPSTNANRRTLRALSWRVGLQVALILFLVLAVFMGWIQPHGILSR